MASVLEQLRTMTTVVSDTGDFNAIKEFKPQDATTNPSLLQQAAEMDAYKPIVDDVLKTARKEAGDNATDKDVAALAFKTLAVAFGRKILDMEQARDIIKQYDQAGISRDRVLIKVASTWEGIKAAEQLEKEGIHCNLTLLFGLHQAIACAEAKVTLISPFVGRILDWYKKDTGKDYQGADDPGVQSVTTIYNYYKKFGYKTVVMGASFRNTGEIKELAGCDLLTKLLGELEKDTADLPRKLDPAKSQSMDIQKITIDKATFEKMHAEDRMAHDKLKEGIEGFSKALEDLEQMLAKRVSEINEKQTVNA